jgi:N-acyl-D-aspartate/D-glutamate deacylase
MDILIKNGLIVDGTGAAPFMGDVLVSGDRIREVGRDLQAPGALVVDAAGKTVIPGLIDPHLHEEWICFVDGRYEMFLRQGVTTTVNGNCGHSILPGPRKSVVDYYYGNGLMSERQREAYLKTFPTWEDFDGYAQAVENKGVNINLCVLMGHGSLRQAAMKGAHERPPTKEEAAEMTRVLGKALSQGAFGISYGLDYVPGRYATTEELAQFAEPVQKAGGVAACHLRHRLGVLEATEEFLEVGRRTGVRLQVSHLKPSCPEAFAAVKQYADAGGKARARTARCCS